MALSRKYRRLRLPLRSLSASGFCSGVGPSVVVFVVEYAGMAGVESVVSQVPLAFLACPLRPNNALHPTPVVGLSGFTSAFAPARVS